VLRNVKRQFLAEVRGIQDPWGIDLGGMIPPWGKYGGRGKISRI
jgi:hypothetical protein